MGGVITRPGDISLPAHAFPRHCCFQRAAAAAARSASCQQKKAARNWFTVALERPQTCGLCFFAGRERIRESVWWWWQEPPLVKALSAGEEPPRKQPKCPGLSKRRENGFWSSVIFWLREKQRRGIGYVISVVGLGLKDPLLSLSQPASTIGDDIRGKKALDRNR